ncbi:sodium/glutamate symporter [Myroides phaeus]|uniref:sodium/glutamate symporter n=1 Tax=Myroides phaeus TaxID=702745 RepID=UPI002DBE2A7B|nr:sodium/glutamate symporter [Myroides phaeus]MEC4115856.1 sodium/glutamate symporter [Myroides phaeus]
MEFGIYETLMLACLVLLLGRFLVQKINFFKKYNIPEPVVGGFLVALLSWGAFAFLNKEFTFHEGLQNSMMYIFFSSIGLNADFSKLIKGGKALVIFLVIAALFILCQNSLGVLMAKLMNIDLRFGLIAGSITLTGGHGTAGAWANDFMASGNPLLGAKEIGLACATFGLIFGGTIGGPLAHRLLKKKNYTELSPEEIEFREETHEMSDEAFPAEKVTYKSIMITVTMLSVCLVLGQVLANWNAQYSFKLPTFVWCLFVGVIIRNVLSNALKVKINNEPVDILGNVGLSIFLACALMSLKLWLIVDLALPVLVILIVQVILMWLFAANVTYRVMGKDYDAIILSAGHCGFGLGATSTAVANIQAVTNRFGPSYKAFLIIPMVGAFFIDILNALILNLFISFI